MKTGIELIAEERQRQMDVEGFDIKHDVDCYKKGDLANAAAVYCIDPMGGDATGIVETLWPWDEKSLKISCVGNTDDDPVGRIRDLQKAGALIAAEIDRITHAYLHQPTKLDVVDTKPEKAMIYKFTPF